MKEEPFQVVLLQVHFSVLFHSVFFERPSFRSGRSDVAVCVVVAVVVVAVTTKIDNKDDENVDNFIKNLSNTQTEEIAVTFISAEKHFADRLFSRRIIWSTDHLAESTVNL